MELTKLLFVLTVVGTTALAGPSSVRPSQPLSSCSRRCQSLNNPKFRYVQGQVYTYSYEAVTSTKIIGLSNDDAKTKFTAQVDIEVHGTCEFQLRLKNVQVDMPQLDAARIAEYKAKLTANGLMFSFDDGHIKHVCPSPEPTWVVNVKRGILSAMQNNMHSLTSDFSDHEVDVVGNCITDYKHSSTFWGGSEILKTKKIDSCTRRHGNRSMIQSDHYFSIFAGIQNLPLFHSVYECKQKTDKNLIFASIVCKEHHHVKLFSNRENGATTEVVTRLTFVSKQSIASRPSPISVRKDLLFEHEDEKMSVGSVRDAEGILYKVCQKSRDAIKPDVPELFNDLVVVMQKLSESDIQTLYQKLSNNQICTSQVAMYVFLDALPAAGNAGSIATMVKLIREKKISSSTEMSWYTSLAFNPRPTEEAIKALLPLLRASIADVKTDALLGVSSMMHTYCRLNVNCESSPAMTQVFTALQKFLGYKCRARSETEERAVIAALKAFGNIGRLGSAESTVKECYEHPSTKLPIRLAAVEAYRRVPCSREETQRKINLMKMSGEDVELRIAAYLSAMKCAAIANTFVSQIVNQLEVETSNQMASFMWSHLTNLQETSSPVKQHLKSKLMTHSLKERKPNDFRKFSRNYEWSMMSEKYNVGGDLESNVIFTPKSFLPQSFMSNITANMFGYSVNFLEVGGRMQGLDKYVEKYLSKHSSMSALRDLYKSIPDTLRRKAEEIENGISGRNKRTTYDQGRLESIDQQVNEIGETQPDGSIHIKIFGNEIKFFTLEDIKTKMANGYSIKQVLDKLAQGLNFDIAKSMIFANNKLSVPTIAGLPVRLTVNATSTLRAKVKGKFELRDLLLNPRSIDIDGSIEPSGALQLSSAMYVDTGVSKHGMKMKANYHSSTVNSGKLFIKNGEFKLKFNTPAENSEILSMDSEILMLQPGSERSVNLISSNTYSYDDCLESLYKPLGMHFCLKSTLPKPFYSRGLPFFPMNGPRSFKLFVKKADKSMQGYEFSGMFKKPEYLGGSTILKLDFNTPRSQVDRHVSLDINWDVTSMKLSTKLKSPIASLDVIGSSQRINEASMKAELNAVYTGSKRYSVNTQFNLEAKSTGYECQPTIRIELPDSTPIVMNGKVHYGLRDQTFHSLEYNLKSSSPAPQQYTVDGMFKKEGNLKESFKIVSKFNLATPKMIAKYDATINKDNNKVSGADIVFSYKPEGKQMHVLSWNTKVKNLSTETLTKMNTITGMTSSLYPKYNWQLTWDVQMTTGYIENQYVIGYGPNMNRDHHKIRYLEIIQYKLGEDNSLQSVDLKFDLKQQSKAIDYGMHVIVKKELNGKLPHLTMNSTVTYAPQKSIKTSADLNVESLDPIKMSAEAILESPENRFVFRENVIQKSDKTGFDGHIFLRWAPDKSMKHEYEVKLDKPESTDNIKLTGKITGQGYNVYPIDYEISKQASSTGMKYNAEVSVRRVPKYKAELTHALQWSSASALWNMPYTSGQAFYDNEPKMGFELIVKEPRMAIRGDFKKVDYAVDARLSFDRYGDEPKQYSAIVHWDKNANKVHNVQVGVKYNRADLAIVGIKVSEEYIYGQHSIIVKLAVPQRDVVQFKAGYKLGSDNKLDAHVNYMHNNRRLLFGVVDAQVTFNQRYPLPDFQLGFRLDSSYYESIKDITFNYKRQYKYTSQTRFSLEERISLKYAPNKEITATHNADFVLNMRGERLESATLSGRHIITTPFEGYEKQETNYNGNFAMYGAMTISSKTKFNDVLAYEQSLVLKRQEKGRKFEYSLVDSMYKKYDFAVSMSASKDDDLKKYVYDLSYTNKDGKYKVNYDRDASQNTKVTTLNLLTPYESLRNLKMTKRSTEVSLLDFEIVTEWNEGHRTNLIMRESNANGYYKLTGDVSAPWFERTKMEFSLNGPREKLYLLEVTQGGRKILESSVGVRATNTRTVIAALLKVNRKRIVDVNIDGVMSALGYSATITSAGAHSKITMTTEFKFIQNGYQPKVKICLDSTNQCLETDAKILIKKLEAQVFDIEVQTTMKTSPHHIMQTNFEITKESGYYSSKLKMYVNKMRNKYFGYDFLYDRSKHNFKIELLSSARKVLLRYDSVENRQTSTWTVKLAGQESGHDLIASLQKTVHSHQQSTYRLQVSHPSLRKPIVVKHQIRRVNNQDNMQTDIEFSADRTRNLMVKASIGNVNKNFTASMRIYTPYSKKVDINLQAHLGLGRTQLTTGALASWQTKDARAKPKEIYIFSVIRYEGNTFDFFFRKPGRVINVNGNYRKGVISSGKQGLIIKAEAVNNYVRKNADIEVGLGKDLLLNLVISDVQNPSQGYKVSMSEPNKYHLRMVFNKKFGGRNIKDFQIDFYRNSSHIVHTQVEWNPLVVKSLVRNIRENVEILRASMSSKPEFMNDVSEEIYEKIKVVSDAVKQEIVNPMREHVKQDFQQMKEEMKREYGMVKEMVKKHTQDASAIIERERTIIKENLKRAFQPFYEKIQELKQMISTRWEEIRATFEQKYPSLYNSTSHSINSFVTTVSDFYTEAASGAILESFYYQWNSTNSPSFYSYNITDSIDNWYSDVYESWEQKIENFKIETRQWLAKFCETPFYLKIVEYRTYLKDKIGEYRYRLNNYLESVKQELDKYPELVEFYENLRLYFNQMTESYLTKTPYTFYDYINLFKIFVPYNPVVNMKEGAVSFDLALPYTPDAVQDWSSSKKDISAYSPWDVYYKVKPHSNPSKWIPPFDAEATIIGSKHFMTFDKKHYDFVGKCSYVLVKNNHNMTVIAHYDQNRRISLTVELNDKRIHIDHDFKVMLNNQEYDLPINMDDVVVTRLSNTVTIRNRNIDLVKCDWVHDICTVQVSGWSFGKTVGMFGKYDNEPSTDVQKPSGESVTEVYKMADSWGVSGQCSTLQNLATRSEPLKTSQEYRRCASYFEATSSPFRPYFSVVKPDEYMKMCLSSSQRDNKLMCSTSAAYIAACKRKEVNSINMPDDCVTCDLRRQNSKILKRGESVEIKPDMTRKSADIVYIVENRNCNNDIIKKLLSQPPMTLSRELRAQSIYSKVTVVSYGGKTEPQVHTARKNLFYSFRDMVLAMKTLYNMPRAADNEPSNAFEAIRFASELPFRPTAAKVFILVKCSTCHDNESISYADTQQLLLQQGIVVHVMTPDAIVVKFGNVGKSKKMFGISAKTVFSQKDVSQKELIGNPNLRTVVAIPKDLCVALAQEVNGTFFTVLPITKFTSLEKNFKLVMSRQITLTAVPYACQQCHCVSTFDGVGKTICNPCHIPEPLRSSNNYQTKDDVNMILKRFNRRRS